MWNTTLGCYFGKAGWGIVLNVHSDSLKKRFSTFGHIMVVNHEVNVRGSDPSGSKESSEPSADRGPSSGHMTAPCASIMWSLNATPSLSFPQKSRKWEIVTQTWGLSCICCACVFNSDFKIICLWNSNRFFTPLWAPLESEVLDLAAATSSSQTKAASSHITSH